MNGLHTQLKIFLFLPSFFMKFTMNSLLRYMLLHNFLNERRTLDDSVSNYKGK